VYVFVFVCVYMVVYAFECLRVSVCVFVVKPQYVVCVFVVVGICVGKRKSRYACV